VTSCHYATLVHHASAAASRSYDSGRECDVISYTLQLPLDEMKGACMLGQRDSEGRTLPWMRISVTVVRMHAPLERSRYCRTPSDWNLTLPSWRRRTQLCSSFLQRTYCDGSARSNAAASRFENHIRVQSRPQSRYMAPTTASKQLAILSLARWQLFRRIFCNESY
jgi:hypothetical protein